MSYITVGRENSGNIDIYYEDKDFTNQLLVSFGFS